MEPWKPDRLLASLLVASALTFVLFWLPSVRGLFDGPTYEWAGFGGLRGRGTSGDYWFPLLGSAAALAFLFFGWRGARGPIPWLLTGWFAFLAAGSIQIALSDPEGFRFRGDTLGVDVSLTWAGPILLGVLALLALGWTLRTLRRPDPRPVSPWSRRNTRILALALALLPIQLVLLRFGEPHGTTDQIGVLVTLGQWAILNAAFLPRPVPEPAAAGRSRITA